MRKLAVAIAFLCAGDALAGEAYRLPANVTPDRYSLTLTADLKAARFTGREKIGVRVAAATREVTLHSVELEIGGG